MLTGAGSHLPLETGPIQLFTASPSSGVPPFTSQPVAVEQACILNLAVGVHLDEISTPELTIGSTT